MAPSTSLGEPACKTDKASETKSQVQESQLTECASKDKEMESQIKTKPLEEENKGSKPCPNAVRSHTDTNSVPVDNLVTSDSVTVVSSNIASSAAGVNADLVAPDFVSTAQEDKCSDIEQVEVKSDDGCDVAKELKTREKGELVVVGAASDRTTPSAESQASSNATKGL